MTLTFVRYLFFEMLVININKSRDILSSVSEAEKNQPPPPNNHTLMRARWRLPLHFGEPPALEVAFGAKENLEACNPTTGYMYTCLYMLLYKINPRLIL